MVFEAFLCLDSRRWRPSWAAVGNGKPRLVSLSFSDRSPAVGATFRPFRNRFLQTDDLPCRDVLTATHIEQTAAAENGAFGTGAQAVDAVPIPLWAVGAHVWSDQKACVAAVARVLVLLPILGRKPCGAGKGAYGKARAKLPERFLHR